ncbi:MYND-type domain-containing protein [Mycena kentingensis (nom. inval.)]|nr:MYND-type domain-containing protein [Mycena kentingensis (nom. inval.)]
MHPSLDVALIRRLPLQFRRPAEAAMRTCSGADTHALLVLVFFEKARKMENLELLLPAARILLDPTVVPRLHSHLIGGPDLHAEARLRVVNIAQILAEVLDKSPSVHRDAVEELATRFLPWGDLFTALLTPAICPSLSDSERTDCAYVFTRALRMLQKRGKRLDILHSPELGRPVGAAWVQIATSKRDDAAALLEQVSTMVIGTFPTDNYDPAGMSLGILDNLAVGTGGTWRSLARLIVRHIRIFVPNRRAPEGNVPQLTGLFCLLSPLIYALGPDRRQLRAELVRAGLVSALVSACRALVKTTTLVAVESFRPKLMAQLYRLLVLHRRQDRMNEALRAGILLLPFEVAPEVWSGDLTTASRVCLLIDNVMECAVFNSTLRLFRTSYPEVAHLDPQQYLWHPETLGRWRYLVSVMTRMMQVAELFDAGLPSRKACDNLSCSKVADKEHFRRCSGCLSAYYCSKQCQIEDHRFGRHGEYCDELFAQHRERCDDMNAKDRAFLRAVVDFEYAKNKAAIDSGVVRLLTIDEDRLGATTVPATFLDFSRGELALTPPTILNLRNGAFPSELQPALRASRYIARPGYREMILSGQIQLHFVAIHTLEKEMDLETSPRRWMLMPLRSKSVNEWPRRLEDSVVPFGDALTEALQSTWTIQTH